MSLAKESDKAARDALRAGRPALVWLANLADLELHTSLSRADDIATPTVVAFDLDPGEPATIVQCCEVALLMRDALDGIGLDAYPKTSGSKGMQVYADTANIGSFPNVLVRRPVASLRHERLTIEDALDFLFTGL